MIKKMTNLMNKVQEKADILCLTMASAMATVMAPVTTYASNKNLDVSEASNTIVAMINSLLAPILAIVGAVGTLYCVLLGVKFAKAEEPQDREKAKTHLKNAIIGFVLIFVLIVALNLMMPQFEKWVTSNTGVKM